MIWECMSVSLNQHWSSVQQLYYACSSGHGESQSKHSTGGIKMPTETSKILWFEFWDGAKLWLLSNGKLMLEEDDGKIYLEE